MGLPDDASGLITVPGDWPELRIEQVSEAAPAPPRPGSIRRDNDHAEIWLVGGDRIELTRFPPAVRFATREPLSLDAILHPYLGLPAAFAAEWLGRHALHGGAFVHDGRAIALLGDRGAGKSATLGHLMSRGAHIVTDDILIVDGSVAFAGPRSVDLRADAAELIGGENVGVLGARTRWRLRPNMGPASTPLGAIVRLSWGDEVTLAKISDPRARLELIIGSSVTPARPSAALALLDLAALPCWAFTRPRGLGELDELSDRLLAGLDT